MRRALAGVALVAALAGCGRQAHPTEQAEYCRIQLEGVAEANGGPAVSDHDLAEWRAIAPRLHPTDAGTSTDGCAY